MFWQSVHREQLVISDTGDSCLRRGKIGLVVEDIQMSTTLQRPKRSAHYVLAAQNTHDVGNEAQTKPNYEVSSSFGQDSA